MIWVGFLFPFILTLAQEGDYELEKVRGMEAFAGSAEARLLLRQNGFVVADPMFMDPANGDFRVKPESPALKLGFKNFPMDQFGLRQPFGGAKWGQKSAAASPGGAK